MAALPALAATLTPVINATGRAAAHQPRPGAAVGRGREAAVLAAAGCTDLEFDLAAGTRGTPRGGRA